ncbi:MAG: hypothetical protein ACRDT4_01290 [Micromonosporaceae bacterium]
MTDRHRFKQPPPFLAATVTAFMAVGLAGCASDSEQYVHCVDDDGEVVDPDLCDDDDDYYGSGGSYWYYVSSSRYSVGSSVPGDYRTNRISPSDGDARAAAGLPRTGSVGGTTIRGGGFGSGGGGYDSGGGSYRGGGG